MKRWDYKSMTWGPKDDYVQGLRHHGETGWEAWHMEMIRGLPGYREIFFKRAITEKQD